MKNILIKVVLLCLFLFIPEEVSAKNSSININDKNIVISEVMTYDQVVEVIAKDNRISIEEAKLQMPLPTSRSALGALSATYRTVAKQVEITPWYKIQMRFYCETSEGGGYWGIVRILNVSMDRNYLNMSKQFGGTVYANLESAYKIFFIVNGDFFDNGTTTYGGGVNIAVGSSVTINFQASYTSNHYKYVYREEYIQTQY